MSERRKLSDLFLGGAEKAADAWDKAAPAEEFKPLPPGEYDATIVRGELSTSRKGTPGYKLSFEVTAGKHAGRRFWHDVWLTPAALPLAKRDLLKLGITEFKQLEQPLSARFRCRVKLVLRKQDDGTEYNRVKSFEVLDAQKIERFDEPEGKVAA
jgi:hypothetical protein